MNSKSIYGLLRRPAGFDDHTAERLTRQASFSGNWTMCAHYGTRGRLSLELCALIANPLLMRMKNADLYRTFDVSFEAETRNHQHHRAGEGRCAEVRLS